uniref:C6 domain-containing protein n=1 Tax=Parastrongyloides trichosuri TaxID=131310 RepID=A0A0N4ZQ03_PARTI
MILFLLLIIVNINNIFGCASNNGNSLVKITTTTIKTALACKNCEALTVLKTSEQFSKDVSQTTGTNSQGCSTVTLSCTGASNTDEVSFFWNAGNNGITSDNTNTISRMLICNDNNRWTLTDTDINSGGTATVIIEDVECIGVE